MRREIPNPAEPTRPGYVVEDHPMTDAVMLEANGVTHWLAPRVARRIAQALLQAEQAAREVEGEVVEYDDDLIDLD